MNALKLATALSLLLLGLAGSAGAQEGEEEASFAPQNFRSKNVSDHAQLAIRLRWDRGPSERAQRFELLRSSGGEEDFETIAVMSAALLEYSLQSSPMLGYTDVHNTTAKQDLDALERALAEFAELDSNGDGALDLKEFDGREAAFDLAQPQLPEGSEASIEEAAGETYADGCEHIDPTTVGVPPGAALTRDALAVALEKLRPAGDRAFQYRVVALTAEGERSEPVDLPGAVTASRSALDSFQWKTAHWFDWGRGWFMVVTILICASVIYYIYRARIGVSLKIRKIAGLEAVDEAVGRATEMGRSILFVPGNQDMNDIQTIAGISILSRVAKTAAEFDAKVEVPTSRALVMTTAREAVHAAFLTAGRPDAYNQDLIYYVTDEQFGYVAYLSGMMVREKPAACFYMGAFYAESLILAETGNSIGAIQVAGTAMPAQLPFFVAACDYTLIGEEFFAASAYLSGSPEELGSLKGQDVGKVLVAVILIIGCATATMTSVAGTDFYRDIQEFITKSFLT